MRIEKEDEKELQCNQCHLQTDRNSVPLISHHTEVIRPHRRSTERGQCEAYPTADQQNKVDMMDQEQDPTAHQQGGVNIRIQHTLATEGGGDWCGN